MIRYFTLLATFTLLLIPDVSFAALTYITGRTGDSFPTYVALSNVATSTQYVSSMTIDMKFNDFAPYAGLDQSLYLDVYIGDPSDTVADWTYVTTGFTDDLCFPEQVKTSNVYSCKFEFGTGFWMYESDATSSSWIFYITDSGDDGWDYGVLYDNLEPYTGFQWSYHKSTNGDQWDSGLGVVWPIFSSIPASSTYPIQLTNPCADVPDSSACTYGHSTTTDPILVSGVANPIMSYADGWSVVATLFDITGNVIDQTSWNYLDSSETESFSGVVYWTEAISQLATLKVCQVPTTGVWTADGSLCAVAVIGWELSTASTTEYVASLIAQGYNPVDVTDTFSVNNPLQESNAFDEIVRDFVDLGIMAVWYDTDDIVKAIEENGAATGTFGFTIDFDRFNISSSTPYVDLSAMAAYAEDMLDCDNASTTCLFEWIDYFLWGIFWIFIIGRILTGRWMKISHRSIES